MEEDGTAVCPPSKFRRFQTPDPANVIRIKQKPTPFDIRKKSQTTRNFGDAFKDRKTEFVPSREQRQESYKKIFQQPAYTFQQPGDVLLNRNVLSGTEIEKQKEISPKERLELLYQVT